MWKNALPFLSASVTLFANSSYSFLARPLDCSTVVTRSLNSSCCSLDPFSRDFCTIVSSAKLRTGSRFTSCLQIGHSNFFCQSHLSMQAQQKVWEHSIVDACTSQSWQMLQRSSECKSDTLSADCRRCWLSARCSSFSRRFSSFSASSSACKAEILFICSAKTSSAEGPGASGAGVAGAGAAGATGARGDSKMNSNSGGSIFRPNVTTSPCCNLRPSLPTASPFTRMPFMELLTTFQTSPTV
mmetsp:Transcript_6695/g.12137  ORF Transcript_6695/g.12137 Transcript_6695/m.12137 type:complete len:242 (+) Transcript_6695:360-1085(+)